MVGVIDRAYLAISADKEIARLVSRPHEKCHGHIVAEDDIEIIDLILAVGDIRVVRFPKKSRPSKLRYSGSLNIDV